MGNNGVTVFHPTLSELFHSSHLQVVGVHLKGSIWLVMFFRSMNGWFLLGKLLRQIYNRPKDPMGYMPYMLGCSPSQ